MNLARFFVNRPVATTVLMLLIVIFGFLNLKKLPVREYPNIEIPTISISTQYVGASSSIIETKVTQPIENSVAGIEGLETIQSTSRDGRSMIRLEFAINRDLEAAANDVRDRLGKAAKFLPEKVEPPILSKYDSSATPVMMVAITSPNMSRMQLTDYADRYIVDRFSVIEGVASVDLFGQYEQSMRIWLNRKEMASRGVTVSDVEKALLAENVEYPAGRIESVEKEFPVTVNRQYNTVEDFKKIIISKDENGNPIRISDIAKINVESKMKRSLFKANREDVVSFGISKQATANTLSISKNARDLIAKMRLPEGMKFTILNDESRFIEDSIQEVFETLIIAFILVFLIVYLFIGSLKAALIPAFAVPISVIGACIVMNALNYSVNLLTLLAMVLAIGIVVDDAILVLENVQRRIDDGEDPLTASIEGTTQVLFAVISTTVVLLAVFIPISLLPGKTGKLFTEFSVAMSAAVAFSCVVALTLTPMLCARLLTPQKDEKLQKFIDSLVKKSQSFYLNLLTLSFENKRLIIGSFFFFTIITLIIAKYQPGEYEPKEDRNLINLKIKAPEGTGFYTMSNCMDIVLKKVYH